MENTRGKRRNTGAIDEANNMFINSLRNETNETLTENGAIAYKTTNSSLLDLFGCIGALRTRPSQEIINKFTKAFSEDPLLAMKMLFYARNIRGGLGERRTFRILVKYMANYHPEIMLKNIDLIPIFGRWDDLYVLIGTRLESDMFNLIKNQLETDLKNMINNKPISLLAKWLKSTSGISKENAKIGRLTAKNLDLSYKEYRQTLSMLRNKLNIVEKNMSKDEWDKIVYREVPALAMKRYKNAFKEHNLIEFKEYIEKVKKGEETIKATTLYPYNIIEAAKLETRYSSYTDNWRDPSYYYLQKWDEVLEEQWKALPNYVEGENNIMVMADTSGSMDGRPINSAIGLAIYFAERNRGAYKDKFIVFAGKPEFVELKGTNLAEKVTCIPEINASNTSIEGAFNLILDTAINNNLKQEDLPKALIIISDMEFDSATNELRYYYRSDKKEQIEKHNKLMDELRQKFYNYGYELPKIIYWNVDSRNDVYHATCEQHNVAMVSGQSASTFKTVLKSIDEDAYEMMLNALNDSIYDVVRV